MAKRGARQRHGFEFQDWIAKKFFGLSYTSAWDIHQKMNPEGEEAGPVSVKTAQWESAVTLGDALRQFDIQQNFTLVAAFWQREGKKKRIVRVAVATVPVAAWRTLWGDLTRDDVAFLDRLIKDRTVEYQTVRRTAKEQKARLSSKGSQIVLNPKIDGKGQRRLQCSLPFEVFFSHLLGERSPKPDQQPTLWGEVVDVVLS
jgi:hypothetical protein